MISISNGHRSSPLGSRIREILSTVSGRGEDIRGQLCRRAGEDRLDGIVDRVAVGPMVLDQPTMSNYLYPIPGCGKVIAKAWMDEGFKQRLLSDPAERERQGQAGPVTATC